MHLRVAWGGACGRCRATCCTEGAQNLLLGVNVPRVQGRLGTGDLQEDKWVVGGHGGPRPGVEGEDPAPMRGSVARGPSTVKELGNVPSPGPRGRQDPTEEEGH